MHAVNLCSFGSETLSVTTRVGTHKRHRAPPKGRPSAARLLEINRIILEAAADCFLADGYEGATMDEIAAVARISKVTLYARFSDKESLLRAVVEDRAAAWSAAAAKQDWMAGHTLVERLKHYMTVVMTWAVADEVRAFDRVLGGAPVHVARVLYKVRYNYMVDFLTKEIEQFTRCDPESVENPRQVAFDLMALVTGWFHMQSTVGVVSKRKAIEYGHHAVAIVMAARAVW